EDANKVMKILEELCQDLYENHEELFKLRPEIQGITRLDPSAVIIRVVCDEDASSKFAAENLLRQRIKEVFDEKGIEIPYHKTVIYNRNSIKNTSEKKAEVKHGN
ncbi:MAG: mechanosensitive ion channel family protein, partial [Acetobacterium sp.]|nr:mechanosensitive ion channel family protein [Acetobacterium sp.]